MSYDNRSWRRLFYTGAGRAFLRNWYIRRELARVRNRKQKWDIFDAGSGFGQFFLQDGQTFPNANVYSIDVKPEQIQDRSGFPRPWVRTTPGLNSVIPRPIASSTATTRY
ncbi:MAG: hypothetical protein IPP40_14895 [bacterium]|nr:hypothetical protein [bacterium]